MTAVKVYPWQQAQWQILQRSRTTQRVPHALMVTGLAGMGKSHFARLWVQSLLCASPDNQGYACGACRQCALIAAGTHPECIEITSQTSSQTIKIQQIRELFQKIMETSSQNSSRVCLLYPAEAMHPAAANALLKILEEPPANVYFCLISHAPQQVLPTIRSRCQLLHMPSASEDSAREWLINQGVSTDNLSVLLRLAQGAPLRVAAWGEGTALELRNNVYAALGKAAQGHHVLSIAAHRDLSEYSEQLFDWLQLWCLDILRYQLTKDKKVIINQEHVDMIQKVAEKIAGHELDGFMHDLQQLKRQCLLSINVNMTLALERIFARWSQLLRH